MKKLLTLILFTTAISAAAQTIYVAPHGCDSNKGTKSEPVYSLKAAKNLVRTLDGTEAVIVAIAPGEYTMTEPLVLDSNDTRPILFSSESKEKPIFYGGFKVTGWEPWQNGIWRARVPETVRYGTRFEQFYVNDRRAVRARTPNKQWYTVKGSKETVFEVGEGRYPLYAVQRIEVDPEEIADFKKLSAQEQKEITTMFYHKWDVTRKPINHAQIDSGYLYTSGEGMKPWNPVAKGSRYILENYIGALDEPGEWYLDNDGWLYYMPRQDEDMLTATCYAPTLSRWIIIKGTKDNPVRNKEFHNLSFRVSAYNMPPEGNEPMQAAATINAAIEADYANQLVFQDCEMTQTGAYAIWLRRECFDSKIERCHIHDLGAGGIKIGEPQIRMDGREVTSRNIINNNIIQHADYVFPCGVGVGIFHAANNKVTHNEISDLRYSGVSIGWKWGYNDTKAWTNVYMDDGTTEFIEIQAPSLAVGNIVTNNHIHHIGWAELSDMGAVYTLGESPGTIVSNNVIHDVYSYDYGGWGLYTDEGSTDIVMENNLVYRCKSGGFHQHYGKENIIRNNIFAFGYYYQLQFTRVEPHRSFDFTNNIILMDRGVTLSGAWDKADIDMNHNCYWDIRGKDVEFLGLPIREWQKNKDRNSVIADPMFRDPMADDFTFRSLKTAKKIDFKPFDYSTAGVYGSPEWIEKARLSDDIINAFNEVVNQREAYYKSIGSSGERTE